MNKSKLRRENTILAETLASQSQNETIVDRADRITVTIMNLMNADLPDSQKLPLLEEILSTLNNITKKHDLLPRPMHS